MGDFGTQAMVFTIMVFIAVVLLGASVIVPTVGTEAQASKRMKRRMHRVLDSIDPGTSSLLRARYLEDLSPLERSFENLPGMASLRSSVEQSGINKPAYMIVVYGILIALFAFTAAILIIGNLLMATLIGALAFWTPFVYLMRKRATRMAKFEEQLPEALDMMSRALMAGHPFNETLKMVSEEMIDPIAGEFQKVFTDINYGLPLKTAFVSLLSRMPSMSLNTLVTAVLIQNESGGRIAEILMKISIVIRGRFKLQRKIKTLSAEGRMSAWILTLLPFVLAVVISVTTPTYLPAMLDDPLGVKLIFAAFTFILVGIIWMRKIIRFKY